MLYGSSAGFNVTCGARPPRAQAPLFRTARPGFERCLPPPAQIFHQIWVFLPRDARELRPQAAAAIPPAASARRRGEPGRLRFSRREAAVNPVASAEAGERPR